MNKPNKNTHNDLIVGLTWEQIVAMQNKESVRRVINFNKVGDYGADPIGDGTFKMVPSGDIVDFAERNKRLQERN